MARQDDVGFRLLDNYTDGDSDEDIVWSSKHDSNRLWGKTSRIRFQLSQCCMTRRRALMCVAIVATLVALVFFLVILRGSHNPFRKPDMVAATPPMGWNSWNLFGCEGLNRHVVEQTADLLISTGLAEAGYVFVNLDDCWQLRRNDSGYIVIDENKFPGGHEGMKTLGDSLHKRGLKFGIYTDAGSLTCQRRPGSLGHEIKDANIYGYYGVDYVKNDDCYLYPVKDPYDDYKTMGEALKRTGRSMVYSIKETLTVRQSKEISNMRRSTGDIWPDWDSVVHIVDKVIQTDIVKYAGPGFWNDMDMLEVGNGHMLQKEYVAHFALWCAFKSPLLLGNDLSKMDNFTLQLLKKKELIAVNQDPLGQSVDLVYNGTVTDGISKYQAVSGRCNRSNDNQHWLYNESLNQLKHSSGRCLHLARFYYLNVIPCDSTSADQKFWLNKTANEYDEHTIHYVKSNTATQKCLTTSTYDINGPARLRGCNARTTKFPFSGRNQGWHGFNDAFTLIKIGKESDKFLIKNTHDMCLEVGGPPEIHIFAGPLSQNRYVAVLHNRDVEDRPFHLNFTLIPGLDLDLVYMVRDLYKETNISPYKHTYSTSVDAHSVQIVSLRPLTT